MEVRDAVHVLSDHDVNLRYEDLTEAALAASKTFILDTFGVAIAGTTGPFVEEMIQAARGLGDNTTSTVFGSDILLPAPSAALINAYQAHNSEFDAIHERAVIHPLASILGAALSIAAAAGSCCAIASGGARDATATGADGAAASWGEQKEPAQFLMVESPAAKGVAPGAIVALPSGAADLTVGRSRSCGLALRDLVAVRADGPALAGSRALLAVVLAHLAALAFCRCSSRLLVVVQTDRARLAVLGRVLARLIVVQTHSAVV